MKYCEMSREALLAEYESLKSEYEFIKETTNEIYEGLK